MKFLGLRLATWFFLLILLLPYGAFSFLTVYESKTPSSIAYEWLNFDMGVLYLIIFIVSFFFLLRYEFKLFAIIFVFQLIRELFFLLLGYNSIFTANAYEMYLAMIVGIGLTYVTFHMKDNPEKIFKLFLITNIFPIYFMFALGLNGIEGRYNGSNLDVGASGFLCGIVCIYYFTKINYKLSDYIILLLAFVALVLTGSRIDILLVVVFFIISKIKPGNEQNKKYFNIPRSYLTRIITVVFSLAIVVSFLYYMAMNDDRYNFLGEAPTDIEDADGSFVGRLISLTAGFDILSNYPLGISGYFINLQNEMNLRGYPTFPHSSLLTSYLFYGPLIVIVYLYVIKLAKKIYNFGSPYFFILMYLIINVTFSGGAIVNFKVIFIYAMIIFHAKYKVKMKFTQ